MKFECDTCGKYECNCSLEERNKPRPVVKMEHSTFNPNKQYEGLHAGDIICREVVNGKAIQEAYILSFSETGFPIVKYSNEAQLEEWKGKFLKICSTILN